MRGVDRSSNARIAVKYIERVSIGMEINRQRILPYGKFTIAHTQICNCSFRECVCVRQREIAIERGARVRGADLLFLPVMAVDI